MVRHGKQAAYHIHTTRCLLACLLACFACLLALLACLVINSARLVAMSRRLFAALIVLLQFRRIECSRPPRRIAVIGGGLAGLGTAAHRLSEADNLECLHVYDEARPGEGGASAVAAGLLHPFTPKGREIWQGAAGFEATLALLHALSSHNDIDIFIFFGLYPEITTK